MTPYIGKPVQFIDRKGRILSALIIAIIAPEDTPAEGAVVVTLKVFFPDGSDGTVVGVEQENEQDGTVTNVAARAVSRGREVWRPLPSPAVDFPVAQFVDAVRPLIEEVTRMHVEEELNNREATKGLP